MTGSLAQRYAPLLALAALAGAALACGGPRRGPQEQAAPSATPAAVEPAAATGTQEPWPTELPSATPFTPTAPTQTQPAAPTETAAVQAAPTTPQPDPLGDQLEQMLNQLDAGNATDQAQLDELNEDP